jgi:diguanylate cyclase (GGDEF)-like protein
VIDIQTFMLALGAGNLAFALLMAGYLRNAAGGPGLATWMWARLASGLVQVLGWLAPQFGLALAAELAPFAWVGGAALEVAAYCQFFGVVSTAWRKTLCLVGVLALAGNAVVLGVGASLQQMTWAMAIVITAFSACTAAILLRPGRKASLLQRLVGINDALFGLAVLAWVGIAGGQADASDGRPVLGLACLASYLLMIVNGFGFLLLCKQKDDAHMRELATTDSLTGALNRRAFFEQAGQACQQGRKPGRPMALMMLDLDHFKQINDRYGHACGDEALHLFGGAVRGMLRDQDMFGRLGGEEFALALPGTRLESALVVAERLRATAMDIALPACACGHRLTVSIGLVVIEPDETLTTALARADRLLYAAKTGGRNRIEVDIVDAYPVNAHTAVKQVA